MSFFYVVQVRVPSGAAGAPLVPLADTGIAASRGGLEALCWTDDGLRLHALCANTTAEAVDVWWDHGETDQARVLDESRGARARVLDEDSWHAACSDADFLEFETDAARLEQNHVRLKPFAIARLQMNV